VAALELAVLDAQLQVAGRSLADWLGATEAVVAAGATVGLAPDPADVAAEAAAAVAAGARRVRVKVQPGQAVAPLRAVRATIGDDIPLQADANGSFAEDDPELAALDELGLACLEQPLPAGDLDGHARLAARLRTPICLDESIDSLAAAAAAADLGAAQVLCLKPGRVGGWPAALEVVRLAGQRGLGAWVGGMLETAMGRSANAALAAVPGMTAAPDLDPRPRYAIDLAAPLPITNGWVEVPRAPGAVPRPDPATLQAHKVDHTDLRH
jgi:O-succinylbenzoate synthase